MPQWSYLVHKETQAEWRRDAAHHNGRVYFDDWTPARPSSEWPARPEISSSERLRIDQDAAAVPMVSTTPALHAGAQREARSLVLVPRVSRDVLDSPDHLQPVTEALPTPVGACRRRHQRVDGPFDGRRVGALETPVQLFDLSRGGCFINSLHEQQLGITLALKIDLPHEGWITVKAETLYRRGEFGFAVRFIEMSEAESVHLDRALQALAQRAPYDA